MFFAGRCEHLRSLFNRNKSWVRVLSARCKRFARSISSGGHIHLVSEISAMRPGYAIGKSATRFNNGHLTLAERVLDAIE